MFGPVFKGDQPQGDATTLSYRSDSISRPACLGSRAWTATVLFPGYTKTLDYLSDQDAVFITRYRDTGRTDAPFEIEGTVDGKAHGQGVNVGAEAVLTERGRFTFQVGCYVKDGALFFNPSELCGKTNWGPNRADKAGEGDYSSQQSDCPAEVVQRFVDGKHFTYSGSQLKVGAASPLACRRTGEREDTPELAGERICTGAAQVQAEGCTWQVDAFSNPVDALVINALANEGCARPQCRACQAVLGL